MLSTEKWDNWGKAPLLFRFTALTCDENRIFAQKMPKMLAQSVDKTNVARSFINQRIGDVMIITLCCNN
ncbi:hypothetical protein G163CM_45150 [Pseudocitrobacter corydidari]|jgi:hypothetical protein|uniref:Uncharacterized protein n=1 Tax=Pseudocitrobacter corydidari TaxID=2891570 RepID=A0ABY3SDN4_9ENTR|nr:hypothetical protein D782_0888 [Enterobacteriaceae bacterium strain FGI 57]UGS43735.1 hypothetical protein G163CM_45150 [Pseudocitrobacter corydidari]